jgi:ATP-dependent Clp protease adapter protein ClpS
LRRGRSIGVYAFIARLCSWYVPDYFTLQPIPADPALLPEMRTNQRGILMCDIHAEGGQVRVVFHDDDETPEDFVIELLRSVFKKPVAEAAEFAELIDKHGQAICGTYSREVANERLEAARQRIRTRAIR